MKIRPMRQEDVGAVALLATELGYPSTALDLLCRMKGILNDDQHCVLVAEVDGHVIGWVHVALRRTLVSPAHAEVAGLIVARESRGNGIGAALMTNAESWVRERGLELLRLRSRSDRIDAHRFYERIGYQREKISVTFSRQVRPSTGSAALNG